MQDFLEALDARPSYLKRDECGDWIIKGKFGHVDAAHGGCREKSSPGEASQLSVNVKTGR